MKVLVVGGAGYIGSHVAKALHEAGHTVTIFDNLSTGSRMNLKPEWRFFHGDILKPRDLEEVFLLDDFDGVVHLAALKAAGESMFKPGKYAQQNIQGSLCLLEAAIGAGVERFVFSSTAAVYGEPQYLPMDEKHRTLPENFYGHTKLAFEELLTWFGKLRGIRTGILRYFNAAGYHPDGSLNGLERQPANLLPVVMEAAMGWRPTMQVFGNDYETRDGTCVRDYIHVADLADAHVAALDRLGAEGSSFLCNLGTGEGITVLEMIAKAQEISGRKFNYELVPRRAGDAVTVVASWGKAKELLGWSPRRSDVDTLVRSTWKAYQSNGPDLWKAS